MTFSEERSELFYGNLLIYFSIFSIVANQMDAHDHIRRMHINSADVYTVLTNAKVEDISDGTFFHRTFFFENFVRQFFIPPLLTTSLPRVLVTSSVSPSLSPSRTHSPASQPTRERPLRNDSLVQ